jgi:GTP-binding protein EngB required for normal cell division
VRRLELPLAIASIDRERLDRIAVLADAASAEDVAREARAFAERLASEQLFVTCLGQFKRGKSTLLNALVGEPVLPVGIVPVTSAITILRYGTELRVVVRYADSRSEPIDPADLDAYVSEARNPGNVKGVAVVDVFVTSPILADGVCLVDTPGVGSVSIAGSEITRRFIPHVDAALVVVGVDPPVSDEEMRLVEDVTRETPVLWCVINKADKSSASEIDEAKAFTARVLHERLKRPVPTFVVSASERISLGRNTRDWDRLEGALRDLTTGEGRAAMTWRERRVAERLLGLLHGDVAEQQRALRQPLADTETRVRVLEQWLGDVENELQELKQRLTGQQESLTPVFAKMRDQFLHPALPAAADDLDARLSAIPRVRHAAAMSLAHSIAEERIRTWLDEVEPAAARLYSDVTKRFAALANALLRRLAAVEPALADLPALEPDLSFRINRGFYFTGLMRLASPSVLPSLAASLGVDWGRQHIRRQALRYLRRLLEVNSHRTYEDLRVRVAESRQRLEVDLRGRLTRLSASATRALARASELQRLGADAVHQEDARLTGLLAAIDSELATLQLSSSRLS